MFHIILFSQTTTDPSDTVKQAIAFLALLHLPLAALQAADSPASKPNILIILADDMGYADIGAHGCKDIPTPNIDSIAVRGVRFTDAYANGSFCTPTRAALMSCRYQHPFGIASASLRHRFGIEDLGGPLPAQHAQREGYRRGKLGKGSTVCCNSRWTVINHRLVLQFGSRFRMH